LTFLASKGSPRTTLVLTLALALALAQALTLALALALARNVQLWTFLTSFQ